MKAARSVSLKSRALQLLAQRDQSRLELRRKLLRFARAASSAASAGRDPHGPDVDDEADARAANPAAEVDDLLDWLEAHRFLSNERFAESRVHARASRFGLLRIRNELAQHAVALPPELEQGLVASELDRAAAVRERRFSQPPVDATQRAAQSRFLLARGFSADVVQRLMRRLARDSPATGAPRPADA